MKPGIFQVCGSDASHLLWVDKDAQVVNGRYTVSPTADSQRVFCIGEDGNRTDLCAIRVGDVPTAAQCPARDYNSVLEYFKANRKSLECLF